MASSINSSDDVEAKGSVGSGTDKHTKAYLLNTAAEEERLRLHYQHQALVTLQGGDLLVSSLNKEPKAALDLATGTANWAYDFAKKYPNATVYGVDITEGLDPDTPSNFQFQVLDIQQEWSFAELFDVIHGRLLMSLQVDFEKVMNQAYNNLKPGGVLEFQEYGFPPSYNEGQDPNAATRYFFDSLVKGIGLLGQNWAKPAEFDALMKQQGFVDVHVQRLKLPMGYTSDDLNENESSKIYVGEVLPRHRSMWKMVLSKTLGWSEEAIVKAIDAMLQEIQTGKFQMFIDYKIVYGRKPE